MLNPLEMEGYIQAIAARGDMKVVWEKEVEAPRTDGKKIWLPAITAAITEEQYSTLKHYVAHEVDHVRFTDFEVAKNEPTCQEGIYGAVLNMVEDLRVEKKGSEEYLGDRLNSGMVQSKRIEEIGKSMAPRLKKGGRDAAMLRQGLPLLNWSHKHWSNMYPAVAGSASIFEAACEVDKEAKKYAERFAKGDFDAALKNVQSTEDAIKLAERIAREVYEVDPDEERKKAQEARKQAAKGDGEGESEEEQEGDGQGDKQGEGKDKDGKGEEGEGKGKPKDKREKEVTLNFKDLMPDPHDNPGPSRTAMHINYDEDDFSLEVYNPCQAGDYKVWNRGDKLEDNSYMRGMRRASDERYLGDMKACLRRTNPNFAHKVRTILQVRSKDRVQYGMKRGHLHQGSLHKLSILDQPHYAERIFKKRVVSDVLDSAVFLLVDQSGSMGGSKFTHAATAAAMMNEVIGNVLHIPTMIASFTDWGWTASGNGERMNIFVHRNWKDQLLPNEKLLASFASGAAQGMGNNADGDAVMWAYNAIAPQKQKRKLIIVFSDGQPAGGGRGNICWYTKKVVESIEKETPVNIVGIGLMDRSVKHFYKEHYVIDSVDKLEEALLSTIEGKLK